MGGDTESKLLLAEYQHLRDEIDSNKRFVFERPLLIVGIIVTADFATGGLGIAGGLFTIVALAFNLWFTKNRLESSARIIAYIQLRHEENCPYPGTGWETALRLYRAYKSPNPPTREEIGEIKFTAPGKDSLRFYGSIVYLHVFILLGTLVISFFQDAIVSLASHFGVEAAVDRQIILAAIGSALAIVLGVLLWQLRPQKIRSGIENERQIWISVFNRYLVEPPDAKTRDHLDPAPGSAST